MPAETGILPELTGTVEMAFRELLDFRNVAIIRRRYEVVQKCYSSA